MINEKKTRLMTRLSIYRKHEGREDIELARYYKPDYIRLEILKTLLTVTLGTLLVAGIVGIYYSEFILDNVLFLNYKAIGRTILSYYLVLLVVYIGITVILASVKYTKSRKRLSGFYKSLGKLRRYAEEEELLRELEKEEREDAEE